MPAAAIGGQEPQDDSASGPAGQGLEEQSACPLAVLLGDELQPGTSRQELGGPAQDAGHRAGDPAGAAVEAEVEDDIRRILGKQPESCCGGLKGLRVLDLARHVHQLRHEMVHCAVRSPHGHD